MSGRFFHGADPKASLKDNLHKLSYKSLQKLATELELPVNIKRDELIDNIRRKRKIISNTSDHNTRSRSQKSGRHLPLYNKPLKVYKPQKPENGQLVATKGISIKQRDDCVRNKNVQTKTEPNTSSKRKLRDKVDIGTVKNKFNEKPKYKKNNTNKQMPVKNPVGNSIRPGQDIQKSQFSNKIQLTKSTDPSVEDEQRSVLNKPECSSSHRNQNYKMETDTVTSKSNDETERKKNTKSSEMEGVLAFADFVVQFHKEKINVCGTNEAFTTPSVSAAVPVLEYKMETNENSTFFEQDDPPSFKIITCPATSCTRIVSIKTLLKHILWVHPESVSYQADMTTQIILSQIRECRTMTFFQSINDIMYTTFIEYFDDQLNLAIKYIQVENEIKKTGVLCIVFPNEESLTWKGRITGFDQFKMELEDYNIRLQLNDYYGNHFITVRTTINDD